MTAARRKKLPPGRGRVELRAGPRAELQYVPEEDLYPGELYGTDAHLLQQAGAPRRYADAGGMLTTRWAVAILRAAPVGFKVLAVERAVADEVWRAAALTAAALGGRAALAALLEGT